MKMFRKFMVVAVLGTAMAVLGGYSIALAADAPAAPVVAPTDATVAPADATADDEDVELTYQQQASALIDTVIEDYTVRMAALQAIIDMRDDTIAGNADTAKKLNDNIKLLTAISKAAKKADTDLRPYFTALPDGDAKSAGIDDLDRIIAAIAKFDAAQ